MNAIMKVIWNRRLVPMTEKTQLISPVQFGNRKGCTALDALLLKVVTMDCFRLFHLNRAIINNDATACYDQMIPEVSSLHLQSLGLPEEAVKCSVLLNHNMRHHVKSTAGVSSEYYRHKHGNEKHREGQGKTFSPSNWLFQMSTMLGALHHLVLGINMFSVCKQYVEDCVAESFNDDAD
eukprot:15358271-Ditylum_brightwellii.AAC.1